jgi:probable HAF family extracellular repeat protein
VLLAVARGQFRSEAWAVNDRGQAAGTATTGSGATHAFLWDPANGMRDPGTVGPRSGGVVGLNGRGQVAGVVVSASGQRRATLWTPTALAPRESVKVARAGYGNVLWVDVTPDRGSQHWTFRVQKRTTSGSWTTLPAGYRTQGSADTRALTLGPGTFRVRVDSRFGYRGTTSAAVRLTRPT